MGGSNSEKNSLNGGVRGEGPGLARKDVDVG